MLSRQLRPLADVLTELAACSRPAPMQRLPLAQALGGVLAEDLVALAAVPARPVALRAGYALASSELVGVSAYAPLALTTMLPRVGAGDALPEGCDAVLPPDGLDLAGPLPLAVASLSPGENVRRMGEDAGAGQALAPAGNPLTSLSLAAALAAGCREAAIRRAVIRVVAAEGDAPMAEAFFSGVPGARTEFAFLPLSGSDWRRLLDAPGANLAVAITDAEIGFDRILASALALRPGETAAIGLVGGTPVIALPRRLDAALAVARCLVTPLVGHLTGSREEAAGRSAPLCRKLASAIGFSEMALFAWSDGAFEPLGLGDLTLPALGQARYWCLIPPEREGFQAGERVTAYRLDEALRLHAPAGRA